MSAMLSNWPWLLTGAITAFIVYCNLPARLILPVKSATLDWLSKANLEGLSAPGKSINGEDLWKSSGAVIMVVRRPGCLLCREEAQTLSKLKTQFDKKGVSLYGVLHETLGWKEFSEFFDGELFLDVDKRFFGPEHRRTLYMGLLRVGVWVSILRAQRKGVPGNYEGDGSLLGGVFVIGPGDQGILYEHREMEFGDHHNSTVLLEAIDKIAEARKKD